MKNPIEYSFKTEIWPFIILLAAIGFSLWSYPRLPAQVISHWDSNDQPNGWSSREFDVMFRFILLTGIYLLFNFMPRFDPKGERYKEFARAYLILRDLILVILFIITSATTFVNLGYAVNIGAIIAGATGLMLVIIGNYLGKLKPNWFIGIRTPWTMSSDNVWNKTHRLGSRLIILLGLGVFFTLFLKPKLSFQILFFGLLVITVLVSGYSYILFKNKKE